MISTALHFFWCNYFVHTLDLGLYGASYATCITYGTNFFVILFYTTIVERKFRKIWNINLKKSFNDWGSYLKLGLPGTFMILLDFWAYDIISFQSGYLKVEATAAQNILYGVHCLCF